MGASLNETGLLGERTEALLDLRQLLLGVLAAPRLWDTIERRLTASCMESTAPEMAWTYPLYGWHCYPVQRVFVNSLLLMGVAAI